MIRNTGGHWPLRPDSRQISTGLSDDLRETGVARMSTIVAILFGGVLAAAISSWISHKVKIAEFRQAWINDLRADVAQFIGLTHKWAREYDVFRDAQNNGPPTAPKYQNLFQINNRAQVVLARIKMRLNPNYNKDYPSDETFLRTLDDLLDPSTFPTHTNTNSKFNTFESSWKPKADFAVNEARQLLKREWQETKRIWPECLHIFFRLLRRICRQVFGQEAGEM